MPTKPLVPCGRFGCPHLRPCPEHPARQRWDDRSHVSSAQRGYGPAWRRMRDAVLAQEPWCRYCARRPSVQVDHIVPQAEGGSSHRGNLAGVCGPCHELKSAQELQRALQRRGKP